jgi:hypothetical protein
MPDYENDIVFKPAMTWRDLCEYAKRKNAYIWKKNINLNNLSFSADGKIKTSDYEIVAENRTYEQMKTIIQALYEE